MGKTMKQFEAENMGKSFGYGFTCNKVFSFKPWFGEFEGQTILVAAQYTRGDWEALHAEFKATGETFEMECTRGDSKNDLIDMIMGC